MGKGIMIERNIFIRGLFSAKSVINKFNYVEFENLTTFLRGYKTGFFTLDKFIKTTIPINNFNEWEIFRKVATESYFCEKTNLNFFIEPELLNKIMLEGLEGLGRKRFKFTTLPPLNYSLDDWRDNEHFMSWTQNNPIFIRLHIDYENYVNIHTLIGYIYNNKSIRFFELKFDYESFNQLTIGELHKLEFWFNQVYLLRIGSRDKKFKQQPIEIDNVADIRKTLFVGSDFKIYVNRQAFNDKKILFDLLKNVNYNGEQIPFKQLNKLRSYIDLIPETFNFKMNNYCYVDFYQNKKIMGHYNEIPYITKFIGGILND